MKTKKSHLFTILILMLAGSVLFAWDGFINVKAEEFNTGILVTWQAKDEQNVHYYEIYRSRTNSEVVDKRASVSALGSGATYTYQDENIFSKTTETGDYSFYYFVRAVMKDGSFENSEKVMVRLSTLGVSQQTWGSIKAMFR
jgi:hypothetical protein